MVDDPEQPAEDPGHQPARQQLVFEAGAVVLARAHAAVDADDVDQDQQVQQPDENQESARDDGSHGAAYVAKLAVVADDALHDGPDGKAERNSDKKDDGGVPKREEEPDTHRLVPALQQLAGRVVDRRDVVGIEGMAQAECVGEAAEAQEGRVVPAIQQEQSPTDHMQDANPAEEGAQPQPRSAIERAGQFRPHQTSPSLTVIATESQLGIVLAAQGSWR